MAKTNHIKSHDEFARTYDSQAKQYNSYVFEVLFGMCYEFVKPGESLLDLGIGTGLSSVHFARAGLDITGLDESIEMLKECGKKGFAKEIKQFNIRDVPLPYPDNTFSHVVCCGVFHFFADLLPTCKEACRILRPAGILAFTIASLTVEEAGSDRGSMPGYIKAPTAWGIPIFKHSDKYVNKIAATYGLTIQKEQKVLADSGDKDAGDILFKVIVMQKTVS
ncbi:MAG: class I SAM-dependent methyltransferase [Candidatus Aminicenantes bacterium]|nr:class I SAM-dependent methyltransferase [Candidatus Aminicenantes bacterium]